MDTAPENFHVDLALPPPHPVRLGLIGLGWAARNLHLPSIEFLRSRGWPVEIVALCDLRAERLQEIASQYPRATAFSDTGALLATADMDGVMILTHPDSSGRLLLQALARGLTTFVEKPVAANVEEIEVASQVASRKRIAVQVGYNRRHQPFYGEFRQSVEVLGSPKHVAARFWRANREEPGFFLDTLVHPLELLAGTLGPLRATGTKIFPTSDGAPLDHGWRVDLVSKLDPATTAEIDIRPASGMLVESFHALGRQHGCALHFPYATKNGATAVFERHVDGELTHRQQAVVAPGDRIASCYHGGFLGQVVQFVRLCAGLSCQPLCTLEGAASVLRLYEQIVASHTHPLEA